ncbi:hypothetical protein [Synechococcus sp. CC9902]|uniref:hypothetical protein n=1 Tax=Synechococcus sp. (strain CC9902) TaxID=316279 RepID=UPI0002DB6078|nr:hypothetical protein [Synechococcus sp. CC9902]
MDLLAAADLASFYVKNRRDGSRLLSSALVIFTIAITQHQTTWGVVVASISALVCLYWGFAYRKLDLER